MTKKDFEIFKIDSDAARGVLLDPLNRSYSNWTTLTAVMISTYKADLSVFEQSGETIKHGKKFYDITWKEI